MPDFAFTFMNTSIGTQDWNVQTLFEGELGSGDQESAQINTNQNIELGVAVDTLAEPVRSAAGTLQYTSATNVWTFATTTPNEFVFNYNAVNRSCNLACSLEVEPAQEAAIG